MPDLTKSLKIKNVRMYLSNPVTDLASVVSLNAELKCKNIRTVFVLLTELEIKAMYGSVDSLIRTFRSIGVHVEYYPMPDGYTLQYNLMEKLYNRVQGFLKYGNNLLFICSDNNKRSTLVMAVTLVGLDMTPEGSAYYIDSQLNTGRPIELDNYLSGFLAYMKGKIKNDVERRPAEIS